MPAFPDVLGYIDPGAGSFLMQLLVGGLVAVVVVVQRSWRRVTGRSSPEPRGFRGPDRENADSAGSMLSDPPSGPGPPAEATSGPGPPAEALSDPRPDGA